jgi:asparagine synthase (glutamine-hydrolysing)
VSALAGIWRFGGNPDNLQDCQRMLNAQSVYGSYKAHAASKGAVSLGRRLAKLLPEDIYDEQPLIGGGGRYLLVADLRLDNRGELAAALDIRADTARSMCDAAILLAAFEKWDEQCCEKLVGDYAFAVWDIADQRLLLARDFLGSRPLYYHRCDRFLALASMPKGLHALPAIPRAPDEERVAEFLALMPGSGTQSFFRGVERVEPGMVVTFRRNGLRARRHWQWDGRRLVLPRGEDYVEGLRHHLDEAVRACLRGAGSSVASHLSSGFDSSAVSATTARLLGPSGGKVVAFTAAPRQGYEDPASDRAIEDESHLAAMTAAMHANIEHVVIRGEGRSPLDALDRIFFLFEHPVLNLCNQVWVSAINDEVRRRKISVLLTGRMGNMTLSYTGKEAFSELMSGLRWSEWARLAIAAHRNGHRWRGILNLTFAPWFPLTLRRFLARFTKTHLFSLDRHSAIRPALVSELDLHGRARARGLDFNYPEWSSGVAMRLYALSLSDHGYYGKGTLGGWGIDLRDPTADRRLLEFCLSVPTEQFFRDGVLRGLGRAALLDRAPLEVLNEKRKGWQAADWHEGLTVARQQLRDEISRFEQTPASARALDLNRMRTMVDDWPTDGWRRPEVIERYRLALLRGVSSGHCLRRALGSNM